MRLVTSILSLLCLLTGSCSLGQFKYLEEKIARSSELNAATPREKMFIHCDRSLYTPGDTLWLKGYIVSASTLSPADSSKIAYIEIFDSNAQLVKRISTYAAAGTFYASIALPEPDFKDGAYLLRAYTRYMRNFGDSALFEIPFSIVSPENTNAPDPVRKDRISPVTSLALKKETRQKQGLSVRNGTDLQFLPEGGTFISGKRQQVGFKALRSSGKGIPVSGHIENSRGEIVTTFASIHNGMGSLWMIPDAGETYTAILDNGTTFPFPRAKATGTLLQLNNPAGSDSIIVTVDASPDLYNKAYYFNAGARGISCARGIIHLQDKPYRLALPINTFPSGVCHFTLYDEAGIPLNERAAFTWHHDVLSLELFAQKPWYTVRDSVHLLLLAKNKSSEPVSGSFSVAVIDSSQVPFTEYGENIISYLLLSTDLAGRIEDPAYYFDNPVPEAIDALMLTQGWTSYERPAAKPAFTYEKDFTVQGSVRNLLNKPVSHSDIATVVKDGRSKTTVLTTKTDQQGVFSLQDFPAFVTDSVHLLVRALNKRGKSFGIAVSIDEPSFPLPPSTVIAPAVPGILPANPDSAMTQQPVVKLFPRKRGKDELAEVIVKSRLKIPGSKNLNADGGADQVISEKTLEKTPKATLLDVLEKEVAGFHKGPVEKKPQLSYKRNADLIIFIIDGYNINAAYDSVSEHITAFTEYEERYLKYITAEDVTGIEIMSTPKNGMAYELYYHYNSSSTVTYTFMEITTHSGFGAFNVSIPGLYHYKPVAPVIARTFYSPRYPAGRSSDLPDYRPTLYWKPDVITNEKGEAEFLFYTSDSEGACWVIVQGTDVNGGLGSAILRLPVRARMTGKNQN